VVDGQAIALQAAAQHGQEIDEVGAQIPWHRDGAALGGEGGGPVLPAPERRLPVQTLMRAQVIVFRHGHGEPAFKLLQGQARRLVAVVAAALSDVGEGRAGQAMH
jgi:hypothetical protein